MLETTALHDLAPHPFLAMLQALPELSYSSQDESSSFPSQVLCMVIPSVWKTLSLDHQVDHRLSFIHVFVQMSPAPRGFS